MNVQSLEARFRKPDQTYRVAPMFRLNDQVDPQQLRWQLVSLKERGFGGIFLCCEYMNGAAPEKFTSPWWWDVVDQVAAICTQIGLGFWVYDEEDWPSGSVGGQLPQAHPEFAWKYLQASEQTHQGPQALDLDLSGEGEVVAVIAFQLKDGRLVESSVVDLTERTEGGRLAWGVPAGEWTVGIYRARKGKGLFEETYSDLMDREAMATFVDWVYNGHYERVKKTPGAQIVGFFTDEPAFSLSMIPLGERFDWYPAMPFTPALAQTFQERHGYQWRSRLPLLYHEAGSEKLRFTCHYWETCCHLYSENYFGQIYRFCEEHGLKSSGHLVVEEDFLNHLAQQAGNLPTHFRNLHIPGVDWIHPLEETYSFYYLPATTFKYATSMAHLMGRERTWAESFAGCGWGLSPHHMRRIVNWEHVNGINMQIPICYKYSLRGQSRSAFYPPGISYQQPYWDHMEGFTEYEARACALTAGGGHVAQVALAYPEVDIWTHCWDHELLNERSKAFNRLGDLIRFAGYDFDTLDDRAFLQQSSISNGKLCTEHEQFDVVVVPPVDGVRVEAVRYWLQFVRSGGQVIFCGRLPKHTFEGGGNDPALRGALRELFGDDFDFDQQADAPYWNEHATGGRAGFAPAIESVPAMLEQVVRPDVRFNGEGRFVAYHRQMDDAHLYLIYNYDEQPRSTHLSLSAQGSVEYWNLETGQIQSLPVEISEKGYSHLRLEFTPNQMLPIIVRNDKSPNGASRYRLAHEVLLEGPFAFEAEETHRRPEVVWNFQEDSDGLEYSGVAPVKVPSVLPLGDWCELGLKHFSGVGHYTATCQVPELVSGGRVWLDLGKVAGTAQVAINGLAAGIAFFAPHRLDITPLIHSGENEVKISIANTLANFMAQFRKFESQTFSQGGETPERMVSGLFGPVRIVIEDPA